MFIVDEQGGRKVSGRPIFDPVNSCFSSLNRMVTGVHLNGSFTDCTLVGGRAKFQSGIRDMKPAENFRHPIVSDNSNRRIKYFEPDSEMMLACRPRERNTISLASAPIQNIDLVTLMR